MAGRVHGGLSVALAVLLFGGCEERYRVGEYVLVEWCNGEYPGYIIAETGRTRYHVHFEGYESRWDTEVSFERIKRRLDERPPTPPPLCDEVARALGIKEKSDERAGAYELGARVRVSWRGSIYKATIIEVLGPERFKVRYDGHSAAWDEVITSDRIQPGAAGQ